MGGGGEGEGELKGETKKNVKKMNLSLCLVSFKQKFENMTIQCNGATSASKGLDLKKNILRCG